MNEAESTTARFRLLEKHILLIEIKKDAVIDVDEASENMEVSAPLTAGARYGALVDARTNSSITKEAREFYSRREVFENVIAEALIVESLATRILANFLMNFRRQNKIVEMKVFNDYNTALAWLKEMVENDKGSKKRKPKETAFLALS